MSAEVTPREPMVLETLTYQRDEGGGWIILTRDERMNALHPQLVFDLGLALDAALGDRQVRAVVITGTGSAFCAGADLSWVQSLEGDQTRLSNEFFGPLSALLRRLRDFPKPVIAAVNGHCVAGGLELLLCCDLVVAAQDATRIADGHSRYGLLPGIAGAKGLVQTLGPFKAKELLFTARAFTASEAYSAGLVNRVVPDSGLHDAAKELVATLAARSPVGLRLMKQLISDEAEMPWDVAARYERAINERHMTSGIPDEGISAFLERRPPRFGDE